MKNLYALIIALTLYSAGSHSAGLKTEATDIQPVFILVESGKQVSAIEATQAAIKGTRVLKCQEVEAHASNKGNISLKKKQ